MAPLRCQACSRVLRSSHRFCPHCGTPREVVPRAVVEPRGASLQVDQSDQPDLTENRRLVTVLFADLSGSTALGERLDPEDLRSVLTAYFTALAGEIRRYGGTIDKYIGDAVMAVFGAPVAHEDDPERAISAAIGIHSSVTGLNKELHRHFGLQLSLRIGLNTGEVVAGLLGGDAGGAYTIVGDTVNTAQRLEAAAQPGSILVGELTRQLAHTMFDFDAVPPLVLRGKAEPQPAYRVLGPRYESLDPTRTPLIGRSDEMILMRGALEAASKGSGGFVHLLGEAGIGKSRLVQELRATAPASTVQVIGRCMSFEMSQPYALLARLLRDVARIPRGLDRNTANKHIENVLQGLGTAVDPFDRELLLDVIGYTGFSIDPRSHQGALVHLLQRLLHAYTETGTMLIVAEDLQWCDPASMDLLAEIAREIPNRRCLLLSTARPGWTPTWRPHFVISLDALGEAAGGELIQAGLGGRVEDSLAETILQRAGGNPFFIEEIINSLRDTGVLVERRGRIGLRGDAKLNVPATVQEVVAARLDRLPSQPKHVLQVAAVIGRVFRRRVLERLAPPSSLADDLRMLEHEGYLLPHTLQPEPTFTFRHTLLQEVAYHSQLLAQRKATHAAIGHALLECFADQQDHVVGELAYHFGQSDDHSQAVFWLVRAGDGARAVFANEEALAQYHAALEHATRGSGELESAAILERIGDVQILIGQCDKAIDILRSALVHCGEQSGDASRGGSVAAARELVARLNRRLATALLLTGAYAEAANVLEQTMQALEDPKHAEAARILLAEGQLRYRRGDFMRARAALGQAVELSTQLGADDLLAEGLKQLGNVGLELGELSVAAEYYSRSRLIYERLEDLLGIADMRSNMGIVYRRTGRWDDALSEYRAALALRERIGHRLGIGTIYNNIAEVYRSRGEPALAIPSFQQAIETWSSIGHALFVGLALVGLGAARVEIGTPAQGRVDLLEAERRFQQLGSTIYLPDLYRYLAEAELALGNLTAAEQAIEKSLEHARTSTAKHQEAAALRVAAQIELARDETEAARRDLEFSVAILQQSGDKIELDKARVLLEQLNGEPARSAAR